MSLQKLVDIVHGSAPSEWKSSNIEAFDSMFGGENGRYPKAAREALTLRAPVMSLAERKL